MTYADERVMNELEMYGLMKTGSAEECRERLADHIELVFNDYLAAWEVRTGRPWDDMNAQEAKQLLNRCPQLIFNPGLLSRL